MAQAMGADLDAVRRFVDERRLRVDTSYTDLGSSGIWSGGKNKNLYVSMRNYKVEWLQRIQNAEIHPFFLPCDIFVCRACAFKGASPLGSRAPQFRGARRF